GIVKKFGVTPESIPDYLALVGDSADGYPGLPGWGAKSSAAVLGKFIHLEAVPRDSADWHVNAANATALAATLVREWETALLFRKLATPRTATPLSDAGERRRWRARPPASPKHKARLDAPVTTRRRTPARRSPSE